MAGEKQETPWPLPRFSFSVTGMPGHPVFQEVTGLETKGQVIDDRARKSSIFSPVQMPGHARVGNVTMKKGIFVAGPLLWTWFESIRMNRIARSNIVVSLLDQTGAAPYRWQLNNAFPTKVTGTDLKSDGNEVAVESIEVAFETMTIALGGS